MPVLLSGIPFSQEAEEIEDILLSSYITLSVRSFEENSLLKYD
jgi:hypothetical protein